MGYGRLQERQWAEMFNARHAEFGLPADLFGKRIRNEYGTEGKLVGLGHLVSDKVVYLIVESNHPHPLTGDPVRGVMHWELNGPHKTKWVVA